jgi:hypothetical protein
MALMWVQDNGGIVVQALSGSVTHVICIGSFDEASLITAGQLSPSVMFNTKPLLPSSSKGTTLNGVPSRSHLPSH